MQGRGVWGGGDSGDWRVTVCLDFQLAVSLLRPSLRNLPGPAVVLLFGQRAAFTEGQVCGASLWKDTRKMSRGLWQPPFSQFTSCSQVWSPAAPQPSEVLREPLQDSDLSNSGAVWPTSEQRRWLSLPTLAAQPGARLPLPSPPGFSFSHTHIPTPGRSPRCSLCPGHISLAPPAWLLLPGELPPSAGRARPGCPERPILPVHHQGTAPPYAAHVAGMTYFYVCRTVGRGPGQQGPVWLNE